MTNKVRNPKSEIRRNFEGPKLEIGNRSVPPDLELSNLSAWNLFRISDFGFRISSALLLLLASAPLLEAFDPAQPEPIPKLRPPRAEMPPAFWERYGVWVLVAVVLLLLLAGGLVWLLRRPKAPVIVPPAVQARVALEPLLQQPEDGALLSRVSQILRRYVAAAFGLPSGELTTTEFCGALAGQEQIGPELSTAISAFLRQCDERKFAPLPPAQAFGAVAQVLQLIELAEARRAAVNPVAGAGSGAGALLSGKAGGAG
jgi:hypothetical protein